MYLYLTNLIDSAMSLKKLILLACADLVLLAGLQAQRSPWSISISGGASFPAGKFAGKKFADTTESFARLGPVLNLHLEYRLSSRFGWALSFTGQENLVDINSMEQQVNPTTDSSVSHTTVSSGSWYIGKIMTGPTLSLPMGRRKIWYFTSRLMAGVLKTAEPKLGIYTGTTYTLQGVGNVAAGYGGFAAYTASYSYQGKIGLPWAFSWQGSVGILYPINPRWSFRVDIDYSSATIRAPFNSIHHGAHAIYSFTGGNGIPIVITALPYNHFYSLPVSSVNLSMGLKMRL